MLLETVLLLAVMLMNTLLVVVAVLQLVIKW